MRGASAPGAASEREAARWVRGMFGRVARRYDFLNHLLSMNLDRGWRRRTASRLEPILARPGARAMDLCCGTGDLMLELAGRRGRAPMGSDFCRPMLEEARRKLIEAGFQPLLVEADALQLPLAAASLDLVTVAFGFRNFASYSAGLAEMRRVLRPGGVAAVLEFSRPPNRLLAAAYAVYSRRVLPLVGGLVSGAPDAYRYLPDSVRRFPTAPELADGMRAAGFSPVEFEYLSGGIVALHLATAA